MKILTKSLLSAGAAAAALVSVAAPAQARRGDGDRIDAGEVIAGALIIGGIAAVLSSGNDHDRGYDDRGYDNRGSGYDDRGYDDYGRQGRGGRHGRGNDDDRYGYSNGGGSRAAVNQCVSSVERWASRYSRAEVTEIRDIDRTRNGYRVTGKLVVQDGWRGNNRGYDHDDRDGRYGGAYGNRGGYDRGYDKGRFTCYVERGRVIDIDYSGLDQWR
jgi:hypothetical protein